MSYDWRKYLITLVITGVIFLTAIYLNNYFNNKRIENIQAIQNSISTDIASSEVQFSLLGDLSCKNVDDSILSPELNSLADRIQYGEQNIGNTNSDIVQLKKDYSLLEIKDYLLMKQIDDRCKIPSAFILYFYSNNQCNDCTRQGYVLDALKQQYPTLRIYSFDYDLDLSAVKTLITINKINGNLPAIVIDDKVYYGFNAIEDVQRYMPILKTLNASSTSATSTRTGRGSSTVSTINKNQ